MTNTLLNTTAASIDLDGWSLVDKNQRKKLITGTIAAGDTTRIHLSGVGAQLSNKGGIISLLNPLGNKVHGISFTKSQVAEQGRTIVFG